MRQPEPAGFLAEAGNELKADFALVCDTGQWDKDTPAIATQLRGLAGCEVIIKGPSRDLHSGLYGGPAINPIRALVQILGQLHDDKGRVTIPGFYLGIEEPAPEQKAQWLALDKIDSRALPGRHRPDALGRRAGLLDHRAEMVAADGGVQRHHRRLSGRRHQDRHPLDRLGQADLPPGARPGPRPHHRELQGVRAPAPAQGLQRASSSACAAARRCASSIGAPYMQAAAAALKEEWGRDALFMGMGGSIPIVQSFQDVLGMNALLVGFGCDDDRLHAPNEKYNLSSFRKGARSWARILARLQRQT